jgi:multicomponent K+:H+ antiporter subunit E
MANLTNKLIPTPARSVMLFVVWLLLNNSLAPVHLVAATLLALGIPLLTAGFRDKQTPFKHWRQALLYLLKVLGDIVLANMQVILLVLGPNRRLRPGFVLVPLELRGALPLSILACTVSLTPGTVSADILPYQNDPNEDVGKRFLLIHVLDVADEAALIQEIKQRYEQPLQEMFAC